MVPFSEMRNTGRGEAGLGWGLNDGLSSGHVDFEVPKQVNISCRQLEIGLKVKA